MGFLRWTFLSCLMAIFIGNSYAQFREYPPRYDYHNLPQTKFTCEGRLTGRYYADPDTDCQMFHVCTPGTNANFRFLCPNGTVFDQEHQVCADYYQVVCHSNVGTNPLGHIFEIYKIGAKENTRNQEFGTAPASDPVYLGQNSITEDFQAEEYNNNKLASQNALRFQTSAEKPASRRKSNKEDIFYYAPSSTTQRPTQPPRSTTPEYTTTRRPVTTTTETPFFEPRVLEAKPIRQQQQQQFQEISRNQQSSKPSTTPKPSPVFKNTSPAPTQEIKLAFSDFASLAKFQHDFHHGFTTRKPKTTTTDEFPSTTTERYTSTTYSPSAFYTEDVSVQPNYFETDRTQGTTYRTTTTYRPTTTFPTTTFKPTKPSTKVPKTFAPTYFDSAEELQTTRKPLFSDTNSFSDFKTLASFQHAFHHGFTTRAPKKQQVEKSSPSFQENFKPKSETESPANYQTTSSPPRTTKAPKTVAPIYYDSVEEPQTTRKPLFSGNSQFSDFKSLASFQHAFHHGFTTRAPKKQQIEKDSSSSQENFKSNSETQANYQTTSIPRKATFHSTFKANSNDITTTVNPPTFQQQPSRFNEEFFRKIESKYDTTFNSAESKYYDSSEIARIDENRRRQPAAQNQNNFEKTQRRNGDFNNARVTTSAEDLNEVVSTSTTPVRRGGRRRPQQPQEQQQQSNNNNNNGQYKFSRRVENARFNDRDSFVVREGSQNQRKGEEIFDTEASVFRGSPVVNNYYNEERRPSSRRTDSKPVAPQEYSPALFGRRVRPNSRQRIVQTPDEPEEFPLDEKPRKAERTRVVKRIRRPTTTTTEFPSTTRRTTTSTTTTTTTTTTTPEPELIHSTSRPVKKLQVRTKTFTVNRKNPDKFYQTRPTTTTEEPQLITASDDEIASLRESKSKFTTQAPSTTNSRFTKEKSLSYDRPLLQHSSKVEDRLPIPTVIPAASIYSNTTKKSIVETKQSVTKSIREEKILINPTRSPDYDYNYYDSDVETDYLADLVSRQDKYGKKPSRNLNKS